MEWPVFGGLMNFEIDWRDGRIAFDELFQIEDPVQICVPDSDFFIDATGLCGDLKNCISSICQQFYDGIPFFQFVDEHPELLSKMI